MTVSNGGPDGDRLTFCRICAASCGMAVTVAGGQIVAVRGDPSHPASLGYSCSKGRALGATYHHPDRLDYPVLRGRQVGWPELLDDLGGTLRQLIDRHGPDSVGYYSATGQFPDKAGTFAERRLFGLIGTKQSYTAASVDVFPAFKAAELVTGYPAELQPIWEPEDSPRVVIVIGQNPVVSHGYLMFLTDPIRRIRQFREGGGRLWVLDPRRTETAGLADHHLSVRPGTDGLVLAWLVRELLHSGADRSELSDHVDPSDLARLRDALAPFTLEVAAGGAGLSPESLEELLAAIRQAGQIACLPGTGVTFGAGAVVTDWLVWVLLIVTGSLDRPGGMRFSRGLIAPLDERANWVPAPPDGANEAGPPSRPDVPRWLGEYPVAAMADEIEAGHLRALVVAGANPLTALPEPNRTIAALRRLDVLAVLDVMGNEVTAMATHVLPVAHQLERADITLRDRGCYTAAVMPLAADRRPAWWVHAQLGKRLGIDVLSGLDPDVVDDEAVLRLLIDNFNGVSNVMKVPSGDAERSPARTNGIFQRLVSAGPHGQMATPRWGWVHEKALPGGRWRLAPPVLVERLPRLLADGSDRVGLRLVNRRHARRVNSALYARPGGAEREPPDVIVHPDDAAELGVVEGALVVVRSRAGSVEGRAHLDEQICRGAVSLTHGYFGVNVNQLVSAIAVDPLTGQPQMSGIAVVVEALPQTAS
jgi:anaerobic selenocysteine-containing dehydrogenase